MSDGEFSVWVFLDDEWHHPLASYTDAKSAVECAVRAIRKAIGPATRIERIIITDGGDHTCFEWRRGEGVTFPPEAKAS